MTFKTSLGDYINIAPDDVPSSDELETAAATLKKCAALYRTVRGRQDPLPEPLEAVASFLDTLATQYKKRLRKKGSLRDAN